MQKILYVEDHKERQQANQQNAGGTTENLFFGPVPTSVIWFIERIFNYSNTSQPNPTVTAFATADGPGSGSPQFTDGVDFTALGARDIADEFNPPICFPGEYLRLRWEGIAAADKVSARIQISVRRPVLVKLPDTIDLDNPDDREILGAFLA